MSIVKKLQDKFNVHSKKDFFALVWQFIKFGIVGFSNTLISLAVYYILVFFGWNYLLANTMGFLISVCNAFFWNYRYVFKDKTETSIPKSFSKVFITYGISYLVSTFLIWLMVDILHISEWLAPLIRLVVTVPLNFVLNKLWAFRKREKRK
ncbi:GtrA family protein [Oscillospiraceae bacterium LCP25S3_E10]|nr:GtrA family protein [Ruminococcus sp.]MDD6447775.1 GtrA family protein [Ruminococcus sp.]MDY2856794.1 GtrA family protein [Oscillospiraceae bacterium]